MDNQLLLLKIYIYGYLNLVKRSGALASLFEKKLCIAIKNKDLTKITQDIEEYILMFEVYLAYFLNSNDKQTIIRETRSKGMRNLKDYLRI